MRIYRGTQTLTPDPTGQYSFADYGPVTVEDGGTDSPLDTDASPALAFTEEEWRQGDYIEDPGSRIAAAVLFDATGSVRWARDFSFHFGSYLFKDGEAGLGTSAWSITDVEVMRWVRGELVAPRPVLGEGESPLSFPG